MNNILFITKDALCKDYLPVYGNRIWKGKTPNIDALAEKGTVYNKCVTAAPSTVMSFRSMMTGKFPYEQPYENYTPKEIPEGQDDFFAIARSQGYECHIVWDSTWVNMVLRYGNCFGENTCIHNIDNIKQGVGCHYNRETPLVNDNERAERAVNTIIEEVKKICGSNKKVIVWVHLPHVINGRTAYGGDIDVFDSFIGKCRQLFEDEEIFISADHGNMNGLKGKYCYGFDVYTPSIEIPLITPRINDLKEYNDVISNVDFKELILHKRIKKRSYIYSDTAYYAQPHRKLAILNNDFIYIFNKEKRTEELYDLKNDPIQRCNLLIQRYRDPDRHLTSPVSEYYYSPHWDDLDSILREFREERVKIWKNAPWYRELYEKILRRAKFFVVGLRKVKKRK